MKSLVLFFLLSFSFVAIAQTPTIGLLKTDVNVTDGYTLFTPEASNTVYLINNCGEKINEWTFEERPGLTCYLMDNGNLLRSGKDSLQIRDWNNTVLWTYPTTDNGYLQHHDIAPLPNGNILLLLFDNYTTAQMIAAGRDPAITDINTKMDKVIELQPVGANSANLVWEWKFYDHFVQDFDNTKLNFGVIANSPELMDVNFGNSFNSDLTHGNALDYNATLDQIMISARTYNEIYIIDHSTTMLEAASHTGGTSNMGGDFLWRWGNPMAYGQGTSLDQKLYRQHDCQWVKDGYLDDGKITVFNNGGDGTNNFSSVHIITPQISGVNYDMISNQFAPLNYEWSWNGLLLGVNVKESKKSGIHSLPNGNVVICENSAGRISEITKTGTHLWSYTNPVGTNVYNQYDVILSTDNSLFRATKYPANFIGFSSQNLTPQGLIENLNTVSDTCLLNVGIEKVNISTTSIVNPVVRNQIQFMSTVSFKQVVIIDITGKVVLNVIDFVGKELKVKLTPALYFIQLHTTNKIETIKLVVR